MQQNGQISLYPQLDLSYRILLGFQGIEQGKKVRPVMKNTEEYTNFGVPCVFSNYVRLFLLTCFCLFWNLLFHPIERRSLMIFKVLFSSLSFQLLPWISFF